MIANRGLLLVHTTIMRWLQRYVPEFEKQSNRFARQAGGPWRVDETYIKIEGRWTYRYRAVDKAGKTVDCLLRTKRDVAAAKAFFRRAFKSQGRLPHLWRARAPLRRLLFPGRDEVAVFPLSIADRLALAVAHGIVARVGGGSLLLAATARRMPSFELEVSELPMEKRRMAPGEVLVLGQHVPDGDRQLACGCGRSDMFASFVYDADRPYG